MLYKRELEFRIPRLLSPTDSRQIPEMFGDSCKNEASVLEVLWKTVLSRLLPLISVESRYYDYYYYHYYYHYY